MERRIRVLEEDRADMFHQSLSQTLFMRSISSRDIHTVVSLMTKRVKRPDEDYWVKLKRVLNYSKVTKHIKLTFIVEYLSEVKWWIDTSYNKHGGCRGHTGFMMRF